MKERVRVWFGRSKLTRAVAPFRAGRDPPPSVVPLLFAVSDGPGLRGRSVRAHLLKGLLNLESIGHML